MLVKEIFYTNIFLNCPECQNLTKLNSISFTQRIQGNFESISLTYKCEKCQNEELQSIPLSNYISGFESFKDCPCISHPNNKKSFFFKGLKNLCIDCILDKNSYNFSKKFKKGPFLFLYKKRPNFKRVLTILKEAECIRNVTPLSQEIIAYVIDRRIFIWDYIKNKLVKTITDSSYITEILQVKGNKLLAYGSSIRLWDLNNIEKTLTPTLLYGQYIIIQNAIEIPDLDMIIFTTEDGLFTWQYNVDNTSNVVPLCGCDSTFLLNLGKGIVGFSAKCFFCLYDIGSEKTNKIFCDSREFGFGKELSNKRVLLVEDTWKCFIYQIEDELNFSKVATFEVDCGDNFWNCYAYEGLNNYIYFYSDSNTIYLIDPFTGKTEVIYKGKNVNKVSMLCNGMLGVLEENTKFITVDKETKEIAQCFQNKSYGKMSTFVELKNGNITISQVKQEFFYSILILE